ncbi:MAG TPA: hypothetical protein ENJ29_01725 [Bacteroidetes bacterium]|nr:hypothetical protein [Bacteroidota bacterium]
MQKDVHIIEERIEKIAAPAPRHVLGRPSTMFKIARIFDYLFILRPPLFLPVWTVFACGYFVAPAAAAAPSSLAGDPLTLAIALTLLMGSAFILNQIVDVDTDKHNNKLFLLANGHIPVPVAVVQTVVLALLPLAVAFAHDTGVGVLFVVIYLVTGVFYSMAPFKWKDRAAPGLLANSLGAVLIFTAGWWARVPGEWQALLASLPYAAAVGAVYLLTTIVDRDGDALIGKRTFAVRYGVASTLRAGLLLEILALASAAFFSDALIFWPALAAVPLFIAALMKQTGSAIDRAIKFPILFLSIAVSVMWPFYALLLLATFLLSKWYYHYRFGISYPSLESQ